MLTAIGRALRLDDAGRAHLLALARPDAGVPPETPVDVPDALTRLLDALEPAPAYVLGPAWEFLAWNAPQERLYPKLPSLEPEDRNLMWVLFADPDTRSLIVDWDLHASQALAEFRAATTSHRDHPTVRDLVTRLRAVSEEFDTWWSRHDVAGFETRLRRFHHPAAGTLTFEYQQLVPAEWPGLRVVCQLPLPGDDSAQRLAVRHHLV